jgi:hypothetical protein
MRNTPALPPIEELDTSELTEELCLALRNVGVRNYGLPGDERAIDAICQVQRLHKELLKRQVLVEERLTRLSEETSWQMSTLFEESLSYPKVIPYVRDADGIRHYFRCPACQKDEYPDRDGIDLCNGCLNRAGDAIRAKTPFDGIALYRTYNESKRCRHADSETVLMTIDDSDEEWLGQGFCEICLAEEKERRHLKHRMTIEDNSQQIAE